ncbi:bZIP transcription factor 11-like [Humulus lupulus]|uniref:bZIP transcription factor 11-like n=1 Tax=Humulus lupulus TaxID=3486 RepID=UPI002B411C52|nr:bZIP transcription factor 11-like [Humulus lupulus]
MASSSGNSSGSTQLIMVQNNSGSEEDLKVLMDHERKRKRMQSNRESARRSRQRKQQHLDELMGQVANLRKENNQILTSISITTQHLMSVEAENSVLRAQMEELGQRLQSLNDILNYINDVNSGGGGGGGGVVQLHNNIVEYGHNHHHNHNHYHEPLLHQTTMRTAADHSFMLEQMNMVRLNHPMVATADMLFY